LPDGAVGYPEVFGSLNLRDVWALLTCFQATGGAVFDLTWLTFRVLAWLRPVDVLFCVRIRRNLNTKVGP
jgi:hypothetical protein